jgi:hypothetical protein
MIADKYEAALRQTEQQTEAAINTRIDAEIARSKSYKAAGRALAGEGAGYCDYAAKVLLELRGELRAVRHRVGLEAQAALSQPRCVRAGGDKLADATIDGEQAAEVAGNVRAGSEQRERVGEQSSPEEPK